MNSWASSKLFNTSTETWGSNSPYNCWFKISVFRNSSIINFQRTRLHNYCKLKSPLKANLNGLIFGDLTITRSSFIIWYSFYGLFMCCGSREAFRHIVTLLSQLTLSIPTRLWRTEILLVSALLLRIGRAKNCRRKSKYEAFHWMRFGLRRFFGSLANLRIRLDNDR